MTTGRFCENIKALIRCPRTTKMLFRASACYSNPYTTLNMVRFDMLELHRRGLVKRQELPAIGRGQKEFVYFPTCKARFYVPELEDVPRTHAIFRGIIDRSPWHSLATSDMVSEVERSAGELPPGRARILAMRRPREFEAKVTVESRRGTDCTKLIPDFVFVVELDGKIRLFFLEIQIRTPVVIPISTQSISRSFQYKLTRYKVFSTHFRQHPTIRAWEEDFNGKFDAFQVLIVTTRGDEHLHNLMKANRGSSYQDMFLFASSRAVAEANVFSQPIWKIAIGNSVSLLNSTGLL